jgi:hypothetical protein
MIDYERSNEPPGSSVANDIYRVLKAAQRNLNMARRDMAALPLGELVTIYWHTLDCARHLADCRISPISGHAIPTADDEAKVTYDTSTEVVRQIDARNPDLEPPYSAQLAEQAYQKYGETIIHGEVRFDFSGHDNDVLDSKAPS